MSKFIVEGGYKLAGEIRVQGSKNAAFPVLAASILADGPCTIENVPEITDVRNFLEILKFLGAKYLFKNHTVIIDTRALRGRNLPKKLVGRLRGSVLLAGPMLARFGKVDLAHPGGDAIGARPIDVHLDGFRKLRARIEESGRTIRVTAPKGLRGGKIVLGVTSVTGTENLILAGCLVKGVTEIRLADVSPHVQDLCRFLARMGARIQGIGTPNLKITGVRRLRPAKYTLCSDEIEAVTFCVAAAATKSSLTVSGVELLNLDAPLAALERMNVNFETVKDKIKIKPPRGKYRSVRIITGVSPQLLTDEQPLLAVLATQAYGVTRIHDWIYEGRQGYLKALKKMGARVEFNDAHRARVYGPSSLHGAEIKTPDLRAGASILIAALVARGKSIIYNAEIIDRGYERLDERLNALGSRIKRVD
ncbi:MAG: UDP-N-acetylglucosamine 1-carboxyvinyltransferase [Candidatus Doudnabacteria bacterium]|nr:UDP-N-acetylglucosamine 1-carboxyvinyltransferase [Candidatus Doudnabacteria bacterium]